ncbi:acyl-CoA N-acyltransferase [Bisporella sp. PMI_857]|nr:acyl-CoA N-acyltransferase [Bisporella sp. PMI_857]
MAQPEDPIDIANSEPLDSFVKNYMPQSSEWRSWTHPKTQVQYEIAVVPATELSKPDFEACFHLIEETSLGDYKNSKDGWKPKAKKKEMKLLDLKYLLVRSDSQVRGFVSFMPTYEDDYPVIYCYEIHLSPTLQGTGLGSVLMKHLDVVGTKIPGTSKIMLTCFLSNDKGIQFYGKLGFEKDEYSPKPRILRNGTKVEVDYIILSKPVFR